MKHKKLIGTILSAVISLSNFSVYAGLTWRGDSVSDADKMKNTNVYTDNSNEVGEQS